MGTHHYRIVAQHLGIEVLGILCIFNTDVGILLQSLSLKGETA